MSTHTEITRWLQPCNKLETMCFTRLLPPCYNLVTTWEQPWNCSSHLVTTLLQPGNNRGIVAVSTLLQGFNNLVSNRAGGKKGPVRDSNPPMPITTP